MRTSAAIVLLVLFGNVPVTAALHAGAAKVDITNREAGPVNDPLFAKALVLRSEATTAVLITLDAVAVGEIGHITNDYLPTVRRRLEQELGIRPAQVLVNASHCHGVVCQDVAERTIQAVQAAVQNLTPVKVGIGVGSENRVSENRRLLMKSGRTIDVRHAYSLPPDDEVASVGPIDPQIGVLRIDRLDGRPLAVVYNFACHPIQGVPSGGNTADITGFASQLLEEALGHGAVALFVQGCGGDINPAGYKDVNGPRNAEPLGHLLGMSTLKAVRAAKVQDDAQLVLHQERLSLPRADNAERIHTLEAEQQRLLQSLKGTSLNLKTFLSLTARYNLGGEFPSHDAHRYLSEQAVGRNDLTRFDAENRRHLEQFATNIRTMEELTRVQTNLALLKKHHVRNVAAGKRTIDVELCGLRVGEFVLLTFPGELTVQIGLNLKQAAPHQPTFVAGYTNGYIYYAPTTEQLLNVGNAQEDSDCVLAPEWQPLFEEAALNLLRKL